MQRKARVTNNYNQGNTICNDTAKYERKNAKESPGNQ